MNKLESIQVFTEELKNIALKTKYVIYTATQIPREDSSFYPTKNKIIRENDNIIWIDHTSLIK